jgi:hypothetical protein
MFTILHINILWIYNIQLTIFSNSQSLEFETVEVISRDSVSLSADLKNEYLDFASYYSAYQHSVDL